MSAVAPVTYAPPAGAYTSAQSVALASATPGALIYYTLNGSDPKIIRTGTFTDSRDGYVYKMVKMPDGVWWSAEDLRYNSVGSEVISPYGRVYLAPNAVASIPVGTWIPSTAAWTTMGDAIGAATAGLLIRSSTDWNSGLNGTDPYGFNAKPGGVKQGVNALFVGSDAAWWCAPATYRVKYTAGSDATLREITEAPDLYHAIRFAAPANLIVLDVGTTYAYTAPIAITTSTTLKALAAEAGLDDSAITGATYTITLPVPPPSIYPIPGIYQGVQIVVLKSPQSLPIYYTLDGTDPTISSPLYVGPIPVYQDTQVKAAAFYGNMPSDTVTASYTITNGILKRISSYRERILPYVLEQYKGDNT